MALTPVERGRLRGVVQIVKFNWPMYVAGAATCVVAAIAAVLLPLPALACDVTCLGVAAAVFWLAASLLVSYWVYDLSPLCAWKWIPQQLALPPAVWVNLHCGFDESTPALQAMFPTSLGRSLDIFDPGEMTEPSIRRAREMANPGVRAEPADYRQLPVDDASCDAAFCLLSAHELRTPATRALLFLELFRVLRPGGRLVLCEHLRDTANFVAFGPGFLHFHSRRSWLDTIKSSGLKLEHEFQITPFVDVFVLLRPS